MGCRHTQSIIEKSTLHEIYVVEPNESNFNENLTRINGNNYGIKRLNSISEIEFNIDFAIVATSAEPRYDIVKSLIDLNVKKILVEKVVFQSNNQFEILTKLAEEKGIEIYCNFVCRYYSNYRRIQESLNKQPIIMNVIGGDFGLACNGLHYIDLFEFFTGQKVKLQQFNLSENSSGNRRGSNYKEALGVLTFKTENGSSLLISSDKNRAAETEITIRTENETHIFNEVTQIHTISNENTIEIKPFEIAYTSALTAVIFDDIFKGNCILPTIQETSSAHSQFFTAMNNLFAVSENDNCPIT